VRRGQAQARVHAAGQGSGLEARVSDVAKAKIEAAMAIREKLERYAALDKAAGDLEASSPSSPSATPRSRKSTSQG
jgi:polyribonucleotide nucleotidyltransferase